jgi:drug/metabolite transporter (DMT)-like permease
MTGGLLALASAVLWGFSGVLVKEATPKFGALHVGAIGMGVTAALAVVIAAGAGAITWNAPVTVFLAGLVVMAAILSMIGRIWFVQALAQGDVSLVFPVTNGLFILFTLTGSVLLFDEPVTWTIVVGGVLVLTGMALVSIGGGDQGDSGKCGSESKRLSAFGLGAIAAFTLAMGVLGINRVVEDVDPLLVNAMRTPLMVAMVLGIAQVRRGRSTAAGATRRDIGKVWLSGLLGGGSSVTFVSALALSSPATVVVLNSTSPVFAAMLAMAYLHEHITPRVALGIALSVGGVALTLL